MSGMQVLQKAATMLMQKNGTQQIRNTPIIMPGNGFFALFLMCLVITDWEY